MEPKSYYIVGAVAPLRSSKMRRISIRFPEALHKQVKLNCVEKSCTINSFIVSVVSKELEDIVPGEEKIVKERSK